MKKVTNLFIRIFFIVFILFLLLGFKNTFTYEQINGQYQFTCPEELIDIAESYPDFDDPNKITIISRFNDYYFIAFFTKDANIFPYRNGNSVFVSNNQTVTFYNYNLDFSFRDNNILTTPSFTLYYLDNTFNYFLLYCSENIYTDSSYTDLFFNKSNNNDSFTLDILTPVNSLLTGEYSNIVCKFNNKYNVINFTVKTPNEFSGDDEELMPIIFQVYLDFNNDDFINKNYYTSYNGFSIIDVPASDCLLKNNTHYYIEFFVMDFSTSEHYSMFYDFTTDFSEQGIINIENITNSNPNRDVVNSLNKLEEQNKNIFQKIGDIFNLLNPFHENFFGRKLVELIIDGLKSLFIPENEYFSNYFDELNNWFSDRLGFLYYPLDVLFDLLNRFLSLSSESLVINIPEIKEPTTDTVLIKNQTFDFNTLLENEVLKNLHNIYLIIIDAIICFGVVNLLYKKYEEVIAK